MAITQFNQFPLGTKSWWRKLLGTNQFGYEPVWLRSLQLACTYTSIYIWIHRHLSTVDDTTTEFVFCVTECNSVTQNSYSVWQNEILSTECNSVTQNTYTVWQNYILSTETVMLQTAPHNLKGPKSAEHHGPWARATCLAPKAWF